METDSFEADLRQALSRRAAEVPGEAIERLRHQHYRPRTAGRAKIAGVGLAGAAAAVLAVTVAYPGSTPASSASPAQLTAYQTTVLAKAHVTKAQVAALAKSGFTTAQISALAAQTAQLTIARTAAGYLARYCTPAERTALLREGLKSTQIAALAKAHLSAAQLAALASGS